MPQRFGRYVLLDRMGVGGMAEVYRAVAPGAEGFKRDLVVKKILTGQAQAANFIEMFVHEARISALLHHPNVVQVFDFGQVDGTYFLVMELLRGRDLLGVMRAMRERQKLLPLPIATHIAHQVALGLAYAHALTTPTGEPLNIVHRDISPSNVMCLRTGGVKLLDFGVARAMGEVESSEAETGSFSFKGKLGYMAPERLLGRSEDHRVDLFALGVVLWEMLTGRRLFQGKSDEEKIRGILEKRVPAPSSIRAEVPPALDAIVARALERDPDQRYQSGALMADELETVVADLKYHSRMLPALLTELFGSSPSAAHVTMATLPPEFLVVEPTPSASASAAAAALAEASRTPSATAPAPMPVVAATPAAGVSAVGRGRTLVIGGAVVAVLALGLGLGVGLRRSGASSPPVAAPRLPPPALVLPPVPPPVAPPEITGPVVAVEPAPPHPAPSISGTAPKRMAPSRASRPSGGRIARGLSIDPFAEAAAREAKK